jgi:hypothetical protein
MNWHSNTMQNTPTQDNDTRKLWGEKVYFNLEFILRNPVLSFCVTLYKYGVYILKGTQKQSRTTVQKWNQEEDHPV